MQAWLVPPDPAAASAGIRRIQVAPGVEVLIDEEHPVVRLGTDPAAVSAALREALTTLLAGDGRSGLAGGDEG